MKVKHVAILMHGTFARNASWCAEGSACRASVLRVLGNDVMFDRFEWSGRNSSTARSQAAWKLVERIKELRDRFPRAHLHLFAHSHGGNIALYATRVLDSCNMISSLACFSTPFLVVSPRYLGSLASTLEFLVSLAIIILLGLIAKWLWPSGVADLLQLGITAKGFWPVAATVGFSGGFLIRWLLAPWWRRAYAGSIAYGKDQQLPTSVPYPVLLVRGAGDEAASALGAAHLISAILVRLVGALTRALPVDSPPCQDSAMSRSRKWYTFPRKVRLGLGIFAAGWVVLMIVIGLAVAGVNISFLSPQLVVKVCAGFWLTGLLLPALREILQVIAAPVILGLWIIMAFFLVPFGARLAVASLGLNVSAEPTPPGTWTVNQLSHPATIEQMRALSHGTHSHPEALGIVEQWLRDLVRDLPKR